MKVVSHHRSHAELITQNGSTLVNGLTFRFGNDGRPTAEGVHERQTETFVGVEGFSFYHDDGVYSGASFKAPSLIELGSAALSNAGSQARAHALIEKMLADGDLTPAVLAALMERAPVIEAPAAAEAPAAEILTVEVPAAEAEDAETAPDLALAADEIAPEPEASEPEATEAADDDDTDLTDVDALLKLPRPEFLGLASRYKVRAVAQSNAVIAQGIVDAVNAERAAPVSVDAEAETED